MLNFHVILVVVRWWWDGDNFFYNSSNTYHMGMKPCPSELYLVANILKSKEPH